MPLEWTYAKIPLGDFQKLHFQGIQFLDIDSSYFCIVTVCAENITLGF